MPRIYTKTGDDGTTGLLYGGRVPKDDAATEAYGTTDEAVAVLGLARASAEPVMAEELLALQREIFIVGAVLATNPAGRAKLQRGVSLVTSAMTERLERRIDELVEERALPQAFIVPGANEGSAAWALARSVSRRAERQGVAPDHAARDVNPEVRRYLNRLSDLVFVLARRRAGEDEPTSR